jgi:hypothetical protein
LSGCAVLALAVPACGRGDKPADRGGEGTFWGLLRRGITPEVNAASTVIFAVSMAVIVVWARLMREEAMT